MRCVLLDTDNHVLGTAGVVDGQAVATGEGQDLHRLFVTDDGVTALTPADGDRWTEALSSLFRSPFTRGVLDDGDPAQQEYTEQRYVDVDGDDIEPEYAPFIETSVYGPDGLMHRGVEEVPDEADAAKAYPAHAGRPGQVGGSLPRGDVGGARSYQPGDEHLLSAWGGDYDRPARMIAHEALADMAAGGPGLVLHDGNGLVAVASYQIVHGDDPQLHLDYLATREPGHGRDMMQRLAGIAATEGLGMRLNSLTSASDFYAHLGMHDIGQGHFMWSPDEVRQFAHSGMAKAVDCEPADGAFAAPDGWTPPVKKRGRRRPVPALRADALRNEPQVTGKEAQLRAHLHHFFRQAAREVAGQLDRHLRPLRKLRKADESEDARDQRRALVADAIRQIDLQGWDVLINPTADILQAIAVAGGREALVRLAVEAGVQGGEGAEGGTIFDRLNEGAIAYARGRAAELVGKRVLADGEIIDNPNPEFAITESTRGMIRADVTRAFEDGMPRADLALLLQQNYAFSEARAEMIAQTEITRALAKGNLEGWQASGRVDGKVWLLSDDHPLPDECDENADVGVVPIDEPFPSGDDAPGAHPGCLCSVAPVIAGEEGDEE